MRKYQSNGKIRHTSLEIKEQLLISHSRSLMIYFGTPLVSAGIWKKEDIDSIERELFREIHLLPRDIDRRAILNIAQQQRTAWEVIQ